MSFQLRSRYLELLASLQLKEADLLAVIGWREGVRDNLHTLLAALENKPNDGLLPAMEGEGWIRLYASEIHAWTKHRENPERPIYLGLFPLDDLNAAAKSVPEGRIVLVSTGLFVLTKYVCLSLAQRYDSIGPKFVKGELTSGQTLTVNQERHIEAVEEALHLIVHYIGPGAFILNPPRRAGRELWGLNNLMANHMAHAMRLFVVAHEYAHCALNHKFSGEARMVPTDVGPVSTAIAPFHLEYEADEFAQDLLFEIQDTKPTRPLFPTWLGGVCFLVLLDAVTTISWRAQGGFDDAGPFRSRFIPDEDATHPPTRERTLRLIKRVRDRLDDGWREVAQIHIDGWLALLEKALTEPELGRFVNPLSPEYRVWLLRKEILEAMREKNATGED